MDATELSRPLYQSYHVIAKLYAGEYPGDKNPDVAKEKLEAMHRFGVRHFIDLTEEGELSPYKQYLKPETSYLRFPIKDLGAPESVEMVYHLIQKIQELMFEDGYVYIHCWGGVGRTGTIVSCYMAQFLEEDNPTAETAINRMRVCYKEMPKSVYRKSPETREQIAFVERFVAGYKDEKEQIEQRKLDRIRGSLMAGAAGDALGYAVEFLRRDRIISCYGEKGITTFDLTSEGKALVSDDTQMTLFTANGMLMGMTRGAMRGIGGAPEQYVKYAYLDWYYTQTGTLFSNDFKYTWLRDLPQMAHERAPGATCLHACKAIGQHREVINNSKGCGGIMRVAPMGLFMAVHPFYNVTETDLAGAEIAAVTHRHPLGYLPAAMLTHLLYRLVTTQQNEIRKNISAMALETISCLDRIYEGQFEDDKRYLADLTCKAVELAANSRSDAENIAELGEGWVAEETWAIALYCAVRHIGNLRDAIVASVNHNGDSDSSGSVCGNIMGAIYGYKAIIDENLFCPAGRRFEETLELHDIILAMADDLYSGCIISECSKLDTPEKRRWYSRYCEMKPTGIIERGN